MNAVEAFSAFVTQALIPARAVRYCGLAANVKGQRKLLGSLCHDFERAIRPSASRGAVNRKSHCYAYHSSVGFGAAFQSVSEAIESLSLADGWLIVVADGSSGIYRPEAGWDAGVEIVG